MQQRLAGGATRSHPHARSICRPAGRSRRRVAPCYAASSPFKIQLRHPVKVADADQRPLLVFLPGTDGTGQAIIPQLPGLLDAGYDVRALYIPPDDRSGWEQLQAETLYLLATLLGARPPGPNNVQVTIVAESFGGCLALRLAVAAPQLVKALVLVNPATCYNQSLSGLSSFVAGTNLLGLFPQDLYNTAQAVLLPFLVDIDRVGAEGAQALRSMIFMDKPPDYETPALEQLRDDDDDEQEFASLTIAAEKRRLQLNTAAVFTTAGPQTSRAGSPSGGGPRVGASGKSKGRVTGAAAAAGLFDTAAGGAGFGGGSVFAPAAAANFRANLMRTGNLSNEVLRGLEVPTLVISSAKDRMLPSITEGARLARLLPHSRRVILPDSGHAALLEVGMDLAAVMRGSGITPTSLGPTAAGSVMRNRAVTGVDGSSRTGLGSSGSKGSRISVSISSRAAEQKPVLLGIVKDDQAVPGKGDGSLSPRPATVFPSSPPTAAAGAAGGGSSSSSAGVSVATAAGAAASLAAAAAATAGEALSMLADAGSSIAWQMPPSSSSSLSTSEERTGGSSSGNRAHRSSSGSGTSSDAGKQQQQQQQAGGAEVDKDLAWDQWSQYLAPWRDLASPVLLGQEYLPGLVGSNRPLLFVGNHGKMGLYDMPLFAYELYMRGFKVRGLAHPSHWGGPLGPFFEQFGAVKAGPMTAYRLLKSGEQVLLFPGGAREVNKRVGQEYQLFWKDTPDFVRLAARCGAIIVPFAAVGADDAYDVLMEAQDLLDTPVLGDLVKRALKRVDPSLDPLDAALPITRLPGLGLPTPVPIPNLQRLYFKICAPVDTAQLGLDVKKDAEGWQTLYDDIRATVVRGMEELQEVRAADDQREVGARISKAFNSWLPAFNITSTTKHEEDARSSGSSGSGSGTARQGVGGSSRSSS